DGPHNAEALLVDPRSNRLYVASKQDEGGGLYQAPARLRGDRVNLLRRIAAVPPTGTDGAFAPDGRTFVLRTYLDAHVYTAQGKPLDTFDPPPPRPGAAIPPPHDLRAPPLPPPPRLHGAGKAARPLRPAAPAPGRVDHLRP